jgi:hypothetical protein
MHMLFLCTHAFSLNGNLIIRLIRVFLKSTDRSSGDVQLLLKALCLTPSGISAIMSADSVDGRHLLYRGEIVF